MSERFQILSLDGGGIRGLFSAAVLAAIEKDLGVQVREHFDLIVGTSTGGIIALGLGLGLKPEEIVNFYFARGAEIFSDPLCLRSIRRLVAPKYSRIGLADALRRSDVFGERLLGHSIKPLVIPTYSLSEDDVYIYKTDHHERLRRDWRTPAWEVGVATCAAPTYFGSVSEHENLRLIDGGVWACNPVVVGIAEAVSLFECSLDAIRVLSLGTTTQIGAQNRGLDRGGLIHWAFAAVNVLMKGQSVAATNEAVHLLGPEHVLRIDPPVAPGEFSLDGASRRNALMGKAEFESRKRMPAIEQLLRSHEVRPRAPFHMKDTSQQTKGKETK